MFRERLSTDLRDLLRDRILDGTLSPGTRLNEVHLAEEFRVSRTPLREALSALVSEHLVVARPRRGFFVAEFRAEEILQLYVVRKILDPAALRLAGIPPEGVLRRLEALNERIASTRNPRKVIELDDRWHLELVEACNNEILLDLIRQHMVRTRRYELAYLSRTKNVQVATEEHDAILEALHDGKLALACKRLEQNMSSASEPLLEWVESLSPAPKDSHAN